MGDRLRCLVRYLLKYSMKGRARALEVRLCDRGSVKVLVFGCIHCYVSARIGEG